MEVWRKTNPVGLGAVSGYYDEIAPAYDTLYTDPASAYENAVVQQTLLPLSLDGADVLDLGCGTGLLLDMGFRPRRYLGVDMSAEMLAIARSKHPDAAFVRKDMGQVGEKEGCFDVVVSLFGGLSQALHVSLPDLLNPLRPGGRFALMVFADGHGDRTVWRKDRGCPDLPPLPVRCYSVRGLRDELAEMEAVRVRGVNVCLPVGSSFSLSRFAINTILERLAPSQAALLLATGRKPALCPASVSLTTFSTPRSTV